jgi:hypothetical protein
VISKSYRCLVTNIVKDVCVGCGGNVYDYILDQFEHKGATLVFKVIRLKTSN